MPQSLFVAWACVVACACGPDSAEDDVDCERDATVPILRVEPNELVVPYGRMGESWMFVVISYPLDVRDILARDEGWGEATTYRVVATDGCEAEPRTVATGLGELAPAPRDDLPWVADTPPRSSDDGLWILDPMRNGAAHRVQDDWPFEHVWIDGALWMLEGSSDPPYDLVRVSVDPDGDVTKILVRPDVHGIGRTIGPEVVRSAVAIASGGVAIVLDAQTGESCGDVTR